MAETQIDEMVCLALDGAGYGIDGSVWGGEVVLSKNGRMERFASLEPQLMPGGDLSAYYPMRMLAGILYPYIDGDDLSSLLKKYAGAGFKNGEVEMVLKQLERRFNTPQTTSTGRVLDAAAALLGACHSRTYEGEPAMKLEALASLGEPRLDLPVEIKKIQGRPVLKTGKIIYEATKLTGNHKKSDIAASIQKSLSEGLAHLAVQCADKEGVNNIGVSGGVAYNDAIIRHIREIVSKDGYEFFTQTKAPPGDGGISLGQVWNVETVKLD